jgi:hypothetical protein
VTTTVASLLSKATTLLQDSGNIRWSAVELLGWLNDGQRELVQLRPTAYIKNVAVQLAAGSKQAIPADGIVLIDISRNMGTTGTDAGDMVRQTNRDLMDAHSPDWHTGSTSATVKQFMYDLARGPRVFYVYPPQPTSGMGYVEMLYAAIPADCTSNGNLVLDDVYANALLNYILYRAYAKDSEFGANMQLAAGYYAMFERLVLGKPEKAAA